ncbi:multicopper oxidase family protein [Actinopolymorpha alba]|uniref:multicopper oxidase family protein n=1 Tax=Actinopolymorpha alba TaxID=533267 RepID=UPI00037F7F6A|nr:multicopper oxidase domain-containing protein [Actinopolymorpha alba]
MRLSRRDLLRLAGSTALALPLATACEPNGGAFGGGRGGTGSGGNRVEVTFDQPLAIPPLAESTIQAGKRAFALVAKAGRTEFRPGRTTDTWGFNGSHLGPTLRARRGEQVVLNVRNELDETTSVHWHGMHLPASADGGPHQPVEPGQSWSPSWRIDQPATTLWYHPHPHGETGRHAYRGLAGMFIVDDEEEAALDLPREYGIDDIPVIVQDKLFDGDGRFVEGERSPSGTLGDTLLVNGTLGPYYEVSTERVRLRLLNASTARSYSFGFADDRRFALIGTDGGLLSAPYETNRIQLTPAERAEIVVSMKPGERIVLRSFPHDLGLLFGIGRVTGGEDTFDVLELRATSSLSASPALPARLVDVPRIAESEAGTTRAFALESDHTINGERMRMDRIDEVVTNGTTEIWEVVNEDGLPHSFHVHDVQFQVLSVDGAEPPPELAGWKDTVYAPPQVPIRLIMRFTDYADPNVPYMYHCHLLLHEDQGMMGQFVVVERGQRPGELQDHSRGH